ncbi:unnamed protein product [Vitrella brassicaformis CCMP3155]|uniref:Methylosome subunit pICln n=1 Tax=Vitrella brassicaformis (strain CCMP3155) TaxID=1169540 RepID=A0A0G4F5T6_VITBC|nr:unnamed protein product [Vitrella brassicaformis CCMP3155]|eukprot:CEM07851.1 unnamed protein product [Vitrella brassicaformis CCMP3155]
MHRTDDNALVLQPDESLTREQGGTRLWFNGSDEGQGSLYITSQRVVWLSSDDRDKGMAFDYPVIILHAISRDPQAFPQPCIYCQLKADRPPAAAAAAGEEEEGGEGDDFDALNEMRFIPQDETCLDDLFRAMSEMAALHPDPDMLQEGGPDDDDTLFVNPHNGWNPPEAEEGAMDDAEEDEDEEGGYEDDDEAEGEGEGASGAEGDEGSGVAHNGGGDRHMAP